MVELFSPQTDLSSLPFHHLLSSDEYVAVVDDSPDIVVLLSHHLKKLGFKVRSATSGSQLKDLLETEKIALIILDIGLPDTQGNEIIEDLIHSHPDLCIIMVTGTTDLEVALECLRRGADDYLTKPLNINLFHYSIQRALIKRRLTIDNRLYQEELHKAHTRMQFLHHLNLKMNSAYLNTVELNPILQAILVGITSGEGLKFNRAFMALYNKEGTYLEGKLAVGPASRKDAGKIWESIKEDELQLDDILTEIQNKNISADREINGIIKTLRIPSQDQRNILISSSHHKKAIQVIDGKADTVQVSQDLLDTLGEDSFIVVPLYSPTQSLGVIIADNFVTRSSISPEEIADLEVLAAQASLAIEHSHLYEAMMSKISELEVVTEELEKNRHLLVHAERSAAIGKMTARIVHEIRNPLTSIGGTSRLLTKRVADPHLVKFLNIISKETVKIENTLEDLFNIAEEKLTLESCALFPLIRQSTMSFYSDLKEKNIEYIFDFKGNGPILFLDEKYFRQAFLHLIKNRIEIMTDGGCLKIAAEERSDKIIISVFDSGPIRNPGEQVAKKDYSAAPEDYENGLGLTQVDRAVKAHGGSFTVQAAKNGGTIARITLPNPNFFSEKI